VVGFEAARGTDPRDTWIPTAIEEMLVWRLRRVPGLLVVPTVHLYEARRELTETDAPPPAWDRVLLRVGARMQVSGTVAGVPPKLTLTLLVRRLDKRGRIASKREVPVGPGHLFEILDEATHAALRGLGAGETSDDLKPLVFAQPAATPTALEYYARAVQSARRGNARDALYYLRRSLDCDTMQPYAQLMLADIQARVPGAAARAARVKLRALRQLAQTNGDTRLVLETDLALGTADVAQGSLDSAMRRFEQAVRRSRDLGMPYLEVSALVALADLHVSRSSAGQASAQTPATQADARSLRVAAERLQEALAVTDRLHDAVAEVAIANRLALLYEQLGQDEPALTMHRRTLDAARRCGTRQGQATAWMFLGQWYRTHERPDEAVQAMRECLRLAPERSQPKVHIALGDALREKGEASAALREYEQAYEALRDSDALRDRFLCLQNLAEVRMQLGRRDEAIRTLREAIDLAQRLRLPAEQRLRQRLDQWTTEGGP